MAFEIGTERRVKGFHRERKIFHIIADRNGSERKRKDKDGGLMSGGGGARKKASRVCFRNI